MAWSKGKYHQKFHSQTLPAPLSSTIMSLLKGQDFIEEGWPPGPVIGQLLKAVAELEARGVQDRAYALKLLRRDFPAAPAKIGLREEPLALAEAISATSEEDRLNIENVRRFMQDLLRVPVVKGGAIMPDSCPSGMERATTPVGGVIAVENAIVPGAHSADICCSMYATFYRTEEGVKEQLDALQASTRFGMGGRAPKDRVAHPVNDEPVWGNPFLRQLEDKARGHMADQGDGNHFAYLGEVELGVEQTAALRAAGHAELAVGLEKAGGARGKFNVMVTHHGSRGLGASVYQRGKVAAVKHTSRIAEGIPDAAAWLDYRTPEGAAYWEALQYVSRWTKANHQSIHRRFLEKLGVQGDGAFGNEHNFVWKRGDVFLHGKGATPAWKDEEGKPLLGLIPLNMAAPILMVLGKDNADYLSFAPHGAGRNFSRRAIMRQFTEVQGEATPRVIERAIAQATPGLDIRWWYGKPDLTESPLGYKSAAQVKAQIQEFGLADIVAEIQPLGCIMAGDAGPAPWLRRKEELTPKQVRQIAHRAERRTVKQQLGHAAEGLEPEPEDLLAADE